MELVKIKKEYNRLTFEHYKGSLDFDCHFCNSNAYDNYHFSKYNSLKLVICKDCILKLIKN